MKSIVYTAITLALAAATWSAQAQTAAAKPPAASAPMAMDCSKMAKPHDHAMERGAGRSVPNPCERAAAASAPKAKKVHDHAKVHKQ
ncbi:MAG: hypothetical protein U1E89_04145 [Burkholderiaceae bacterium]